RARTRYRRRLCGLQQSAHVRADPVPPDHRHRGERRSARPRHAFCRAPQRRPRMTATRRTADTLLLLLAFVVFWEILHRVAGETAMPAPLPPFAYLVHNVG